ncbi:hypothetical protein [Duncaniella dubosii]|uniref:hypothetical protein n=1 Tax=Duncaniella dubosii TaxID=2518971 RepID=UPI003F66EFDC
MTRASRLGLNSVLLEPLIVSCATVPVCLSLQSGKGLWYHLSRLKTKTSDRATVEDLVNEPMPVIGYSAMSH